jgi:hypothetical protein
MPWPSDLARLVALHEDLPRVGCAYRTHKSTGDKRAAPDLLQCIAVDDQSSEGAFDSATGFSALVGGRTDTCSAVAIPASALSRLVDRMRILLVNC